jgi:hypothetical protein
VITLGYVDRLAQPAPVTLAHVAGDDIELEFRVVDEAGVPANIAGSTPRFAIATAVGAVPVVSTEAIPPTATATITDAGGGVFVVAFTAPVSAVYRWEADVEDASGDTATVGRGTYVSSPSLL